jgi:hypothetical protein
MKKLFLTACVFLFTTGFMIAQTTSELQQMYLSYLREQGYSPSVDSSGDIVFKVEGGNYYIAIDEAEPTYFRIVYPNFWEIMSESERAQASAAIMSVNRTTKLAKVYIESWDNTYIDADLFLNSPEDFKRHFSRMISTIQTARRKFVQIMNE